MSKWRLEKVPRAQKRKSNLDYVFDDGIIRTGIQIVDKLEYENCQFEAGVTDHDHDKIALIVTRDGQVDVCLLLREDEALSVMRVLNGAVWDLALECFLDKQAEAPHE